MSNLNKMYTKIEKDNFPEDITITFGENKVLKYKKRTWSIKENEEYVNKGLRYGENPGQEAALYQLVESNADFENYKVIYPENALVAGIKENNLLQFGKHPGKTNLTDIDNALNIMRYLENKPVALIMKHNNPCAVAYGKDAEDCYSRANECDRLAAFGGCLVMNVPVSKAAAMLIAENYLEVVVAPEYEEGSLEILKKRKNLRIVKIENIKKIKEYQKVRFLDFKSLIDGGLIIQMSPDNKIKTIKDFKPAEYSSKEGEITRVDRKPSERELKDLLFAWQIEQGLSSNSVIFVKDGKTVGIGSGEQDRVGVVEIAIDKAYKKMADNIAFAKYKCLLFEVGLKEKDNNLPKGSVDEIMHLVKQEKAGLIGAVAASDAFFPKRDAIDVIAKYGVTAIAQPGGSLADKEIINAVNEAKMAMVFTGQRIFKH